VRRFLRTRGDGPSSRGELDYRASGDGFVRAGGRLGCEGSVARTDKQHDILETNRLVLDWISSKTV